MRQDDGWRKSRLVDAGNIVLLSLPFLFVVAVATTCGEPAYSRDERSMRIMPGDEFTTSAVPPPQAGVRLLEDILQRLHSLPQLAMKKAKQTLAFQKQRAAFQIAQGPTDPLLAIKPKETPKNEEMKAQASGSSSNTIAMLPTSTFGHYSNSNEILQEWAAGEKKERKYSSQFTQGQVALGRLSGAGLPSEARSYGKDVGNQRFPDNHVIRGFSRNSNTVQKTKMGSQLSPGKALNNENEEGSLATNRRMQSPISPPAAPLLYKTVREFLGSERNKAARRDKSNVSDGAVNDRLSYGAPNYGVYTDENYGAFAGSGSNSRRPLYGNEINNRLIEMALLPPSVMTGIPMMRLGSSEKEATETLASQGSVSKQLIGGWTVWSLFRPHSKEAMLQVYLRHGIVEAIRVFDASLISPELGLRLGDTLSAVKERFGEPKFILSEPLNASKHGQNYVYPISQVCVQLLRIPSKSTPQVVSLFIFNVK